MRIPVVAGRSFAPSDFESTHKAAVVNQAFVRRYLRDRNPLGLHLGGSVSKDDPGEEIIGVAGDAKYDDLKKAVEPTVYFPLKGVAQYGCCGANFELRTAATPESLIPTARSIISNSGVAAVRSEEHT